MAKKNKQVGGYRCCALCGRNGVGDPLESHHIFGGANRKKSEKYGLMVDLCGIRCHREGPQSAHKNARTQEKLHIMGQLKAMKEQGWTVEDFRREFGKNYLEEA